MSKPPLTFSMLKTRPKAPRRRKVKDLPPMMLTPEFLETVAGKQHLEALDDRLSLHLHLYHEADQGKQIQRVIDNMSAIHDYVPWLHGKQLPDDGGWIRVNDPPATVITVPPFSQWYAMPDPTEVDHWGFCRHRARIETPSGPLWIYPHEYVKVGNVSEWLGREDEGVYLHYLDPENVSHSTDTLAYVMSRGIRRRDAMTMLLGEINSPHFCWFEIRPEYAEQFGKPWPSASRCPFAMRPDGETEVPEPEPLKRKYKDIPPPYNPEPDFL